ncbi:MAG: octaprenyl-diphosphate synthase [Campylobacterota bacterium]|nr:octaprenyl-diphosphate synthase [Campylobacterota bacterium]
MDLSRVEKTIQGFIESLNNVSVNEMYKKLPKGKMLRARLIKMIALDSALGDKVAAIIEMIHLSSLLHDDVIDEAATRRGEPSINALYSSKHAVMLGDIFYSKAFYELSSMDEKVAKSISSAVTKLSIGELMDVELANSFNEDAELYYEMIYLKTASLIEATAHCAAIISDKNEDDYKIFGKNLGIAYQIIDDILDVTQDEKTLGKPAFSDFKEGKTTLPFIIMHERVDEKDKKYLKSLFKKELAQDEIAWIKDKLNSTDAIKFSKQKAKELAIEASLKAKNNKELLSLIDGMINRSY